LFAKRAFLLEGLGWGFMPRHVVEDDLAAKALVPLSLQDVPVGGLIRPVSAVYLTASPPGPAGRWFIDQIKASEAPRKMEPLKEKKIHQMSSS
jgi:DNA-binding transcriptional LysR family regulator